MPGEAIWLPAESIYLEKAETPPVRPFRPWNQGDIFEAPVVVLGKPPKELDPDSPPDPKAWAKSKADLVILLGHPCSIRGGATPAIFQNVAHVRPAKDRERERFAELKAEEHPWEAYYQLFPLPELRDGQLWVADFNIIGTVHFKNLDSSRRLGCLSQPGWAFQVRYAWHALRLRPELETRIADLAGTWNELEIWEAWCSRLHPEADFPEWLKQPLGGASQYAGTPRRDLLDLAPEYVREELPGQGAD